MSKQAELMYLRIGLVIGYIGGAAMVGLLWWLS